MQTSPIYIGLAAAAGIAVGVMLAADPKATEAMGTTPGQAEPAPGGGRDTGGKYVAPRSIDDIAELQRLLHNEISARQALEDKLEVLSRRVASLDDAARVSAEKAAADAVNGDQERATGSSGQGWFDEKALIESGMDSIQANQLKLFFEQLEMERLYLRDQSAREGWDRTRLRDEMQSLADKEDALRERLGDSAYDAYLYASGRPNRVAVTSVLASAQAGQVGIMPGDHILRYDSHRIYNWRDLREATTSGDISDTVEVEVERDGEALQFYLARGPMGIRMDSISVAP